MLQTLAKSSCILYVMAVQARVALGLKNKGRPSDRFYPNGFLDQVDQILIQRAGGTKIIRLAEEVSLDDIQAVMSEQLIVHLGLQIIYWLFFTFSHLLSYTCIYKDTYVGSCSLHIYIYIYIYISF